MAILLVNIENTATMALNEFFDYNGHCYAVSTSRDCAEGVAITFNDFYDSTVAANKMTDIPVVFCHQSDDKLYIVGWYKSADIYSKVKQVSLFLEGNIVANASDVVVLREKRVVEGISCNFMFKNYCVIEMEDCRYDKLAELVYVEDHKNNAFVRYPYVHIDLDRKAKKNYDVAIRYCENIASAIMNDECQGITEIKALQLYAREAVEADRKASDGYYYLAMADYQLGFVKDGMKAVERALSIEKDAADIMALKANLLVSMGHYDAAIELYEKAMQADSDAAEEYNCQITKVRRMQQRNLHLIF